MGYSYSWSFPTQIRGDHEFIEARWNTFEETHWKIIVKASMVNWSSELQTALKIYTHGYRYDIGQRKIECLVRKDPERWDEWFAAHGMGTKWNEDRQPEYQLMEFLRYLESHCPEVEPYSPIKDPFR